MNLIGISGKARSGKDTLAQMLCNKYGWRHVSLATPLKELAKQLCGFSDYQVYDEGKDEDLPEHPRAGGGFYKPRDMLIRLGWLMREYDPHYWIKQLTNSLKPGEVAVISDVRFKNEANWIRQNGGLLLRLERSVQLRGIDRDDPSETELDNYEHFDFVLPAEQNITVADLQLVVARVYDLAAARLS